MVIAGSNDPLRSVKEGAMKAIRVHSYGGPAVLVYEEELRRSLLLLKKGGIVVSTLDKPSEKDLKKYGVRASRVVAKSDSAQLEQIASFVDDGHVRTMVETVLPLSEARRAHELSQSGHVHGKNLIRGRQS